jgi:hypothetical protein
MKALFIIAMALTAAPVAFRPDAVEFTSTSKMQALAGKWTPVDSSRKLLDSDLLSSGKTGFTISLDKKLGDSHRSVSGSYYDDYTQFLRKNGHNAIASGRINFDCGTDSEFVISTKNGSLYLWYGIVTGGNPRIFIGRGSDEASCILAVEWASWCSNSPVSLEKDFATIVYERVSK